MMEGSGWEKHTIGQGEREREREKNTKNVPNKENQEEKTSPNDA